MELFGLQDQQMVACAWQGILVGRTSCCTISDERDYCSLGRCILFKDQIANEGLLEMQLVYIGVEMIVEMIV